MSWNLAVLGVIGVGVASAALNFREMRLAASAAPSAPSNLVAGPVLAPRHPIRPADRVRIAAVEILAGETAESPT